MIKNLIRQFHIYVLVTHLIKWVKSHYGEITKKLITIIVFCLQFWIKFCSQFCLKYLIFPYLLHFQSGLFGYRGLSNWLFNILESIGMYLAVYMSKKSAWFQFWLFYEGSHGRISLGLRSARCSTKWVQVYLIGPKSALFLRVALIIKAGVRGAGVIRAIFKWEYHVFRKLSFSKFCILPYR